MDKRVQQCSNIRKYGFPVRRISLDTYVTSMLPRKEALGANKQWQLTASFHLY